VSREALQDEFLAMQSRLKKTIIFVSHDVDEALKMADRIAIFKLGRIVRHGTPDALLADASDPFIESFIGRDRALKRLRRRRCAEVLEPCNRAFPRDAAHLAPHDDLRTALSILVEGNFDALPCFNADGSLAGMVRLAEIRNLLDGSAPLEAVS
jgi:osmoprotectant transport system ATP-binding protein